MLTDIINERPKQRKILKTFFTMDKTKINNEQYVAEIDCLKSTSCPVRFFQYAPNDLLNSS